MASLNLYIVTQNGFTRCDEGFVVRNPVATCGKGGTWEGGGARCDIVNCTRPADIPDGGFVNLGPGVSVSNFTRFIHGSR